MRRRLAILLAAAGPAARAADPPAPSAARGGEAVRTLALNPPMWSAAAYDALGKQWGMQEKPADYARAVRDRYGLVPAADGRGLALGLVKARGPLGEGVAPACVLCHAGAVAGRTYVGLGNAALDFQSLADDLSAASGLKIDAPFRLSYARGTIGAVAPATFFLRFRNPDLTLRAEPAKGELPRDVLSRPPAWWQLKKKKTRDWTGSVNVRSAQVDLVALLHPLHTAAQVKGQQQTFRDIHAFVLGVDPPVYPFRVDKDWAARGAGLFRENCARCHGTYGKDWKYPNKIVPYDAVKVGWKVTPVDRPPDPTSSYFERRDVYDTTRRARGRAGTPTGTT